VSSAGKKHRHESDAVDHGPKSTVAITAAIQFVLGGAILASLVLALYTVVRIAT
jgi:hypothetical protein